MIGWKDSSVGKSACHSGIKTWVGHSIHVKMRGCLSKLANPIFGIRCFWNQASSRFREGPCLKGIRWRREHRELTSFFGFHTHTIQHTYKHIYTPHTYTLVPLPNTDTHNLPPKVDILRQKRIKPTKITYSWTRCSRWTLQHNNNNKKWNKSKPSW